MTTGVPIIKLIHYFQGTLSASSSTGQFFSLGEDDDPVSLSAANSPTKTPTNQPENSGKDSSVLLNRLFLLTGN